jgi:hypothetical protein
MDGYNTLNEPDTTSIFEEDDKDANRYIDTTSTVDTSDVDESELQDTVSELPATPSRRSSFPSSSTMFSATNPEVQSLEVACGKLQKSPKAGLEVKFSELVFQELLQRGNNADVIRATWTRKTFGQANPVNVAVKMLHAGVEVQHPSNSRLTSNHKNIVHSFDVGSATHLCVTEYYAGGSLFDLVHIKQTHLSRKQQVKLLLDIASGMEELHSNDIIHGRLKSANVLIDEKLQRTPTGPTKELIAKVTDFGFVLVKKTAQGTEEVVEPEAWRYLAPEVNAESSRNKKADVFSFAMVMFEVLTGNEVQHVVDFCRGDMPSSSGCPAQLFFFMQRCWNQEPERRPAFTEAVQFLRNQLALLEMYEQLKGMKM